MKLKIERRLLPERYRWGGFVVFAMGFVTSVSGAADRDQWQHPDTRFAAIDEAVNDDQFPKAQKLLADLRAEAKRAKDAGLQAEALDRGKDVTKLSREFDKVVKHVKTLEKSPNDVKAALAVGKYYCTVKGKWNAGLPLLAIGDDAKLAAIASADGEEPIQADDQFAVADRWWQYAEKVTDASERIAYQLRSREWMVKARPRATDKQRMVIDQRLRQVPIFPEEIVIWNTHSGVYNDRGAEEIVVSLLLQGDVVWKQATSIPWKPNLPAYLVLRPKRVRADEVRVDITKHHQNGGGLGEIEVIVARTNIVRSCLPTVESYFQLREEFSPSKLVDGDTSGATGYWSMEDGKSGWASVHFSQFENPK